MKLQLSDESKVRAPYVYLLLGALTYSEFQGTNRSNRRLLPGYDALVCSADEFLEKSLNIIQWLLAIDHLPWYASFAKLLPPVTDRVHQATREATRDPPSSSMSPVPKRCLRRIS